MTFLTSFLLRAGMHFTQWNSFDLNGTGVVYTTGSAAVLL